MADARPDDLDIGQGSILSRLSLNIQKPDEKPDEKPVQISDETCALLTQHDCNYVPLLTMVDSVYASINAYNGQKRLVITKML